MKSWSANALNSLKKTKFESRVAHIYAAPIVVIRKLDGSIRVWIDYRAISERTVKDSIPLPRIGDLIDKLREAICTTHLDLR
jgi:hypothetical protein